MKKYRLLVYLIFFYSLMTGQERKLNNKIALSSIPGYKTLKCDFHMHTVFSDGHVWPTFRVREAQHDGLDVIAITDHIDYEGYPDEIKNDRERAFEIAQEEAQKYDVLLIKGAEISPRVPPFHNNALFLEDLNNLPYGYMKDTHHKFIMKDDIKKRDLMAPFLEVKKQGGFVIYNHPTHMPNYDWDKAGSKDLFTPFHEELLDMGILGGVEVVNSTRYNSMAHRIAEKYNLTMFANSDAHHDIASGYKDSHRPMTLVFAKSKSADAVEEAIRDGRTMLYYNNLLIGRIREAEPFFKNAVSLNSKKVIYKGSPMLEVQITNKTDATFDLKFSSGYVIQNLPLQMDHLKSQGKLSILIGPIWDYPDKIDLSMNVDNILISPENTLTTNFVISI